MIAFNPNPDDFTDRLSRNRTRIRPSDAESVRIAFIRETAFPMRTSDTQQPVYTNKADRVRVLLLSVYTEIVSESVNRGKNGGGKKNVKRLYTHRSIVDRKSYGKSLIHYLNENRACVAAVRPGSEEGSISPGSTCLQWLRNPHGKTERMFIVHTADAYKIYRFVIM